ncbi:MAG: hypothetical protein GC136_03350 [Alphaproteobacteria bacterium]|nr:hypothetical protein [Alphaproteobacteria bacterium]
MKLRDITHVLKQAALLSFLEKQDVHIKVPSTSQLPMIDGLDTGTQKAQYHALLKETVSLFKQLGHRDFMLGLCLFAKEHGLEAALSADPLETCFRGTYLKHPAIKLQINKPNTDYPVFSMFFAPDAGLQVGRITGNPTSHLKAAYAFLEFCGTHLGADTYADLQDKLNLKESDLAENHGCGLYHGLGR